MTIRKKLTTVLAALCMVFAMFVCMTAITTVHAAETEDASNLTQVVQDIAAQNDEKKSVLLNDDGITFTQDEIPMAEAKVSVLETQTEKSGMNSFLGFTLVAAAALVTGIAVALRAKFGRKKRCYVPADDMTFFKIKK